MSGSETDRLLGVDQEQPQTTRWWHALCSRYRSSYFCVRSKAAILILIWHFLLMITFFITSEIPLGILLSLIEFIPIVITTPALLTFYSTNYFFYPLAGFFADVCCGRCKTVTVCLLLVVVCGVFGVFDFAFCLMPSFLNSLPSKILNVFAYLTFLVGLSGFQANAVQYGLDQLQEAPSECMSLFIYWYVWAGYLAQLIANASFFSANTFIGASSIIYPVFAAVLGAFTVILIITLCLSFYRRRWFVFDSGNRNPYKLVFRVLRFAAKNKYPIQRSAFTYCEDELPSRIDFGKNKYGGPFTTEEVEDVKTFLSILCVLFVLGFAYTTIMASQNVFTNDFARRISPEAYSLLGSGGLPSLFVAFFIPLYIFLYRPLFSRCVPGVLKRMGLGMVCLLLAIICSFVGDTIMQFQHYNITCVFSAGRHAVNFTESSLDIIYPTIAIQSILQGLAFFFVYTSVLEFICSQSPHAMKGLLIGIQFATVGLYQLLGVGIMIPFYFWKPLFPSCEFGYYLVNIFIAIFGLVVYTVVARRYKYRDRQRGDYPNIHMFAEEYYGNCQDEPYYDYDPIE